MDRVIALKMARDAQDSARADADNAWDLYRADACRRFNDLYWDATRIIEADIRPTVAECEAANTFTHQVPA